jgi:hypothetical protein
LKKYLIAILIPLFASSAVAQYRYHKYRPWKYWEDKPGTWSVAIEGGVTRYAGDMSEEKDIFRRPRLGVEGAASILYRFAERLSARADGRLYFIWGKHENTRVWYNNLSFAAINPEICAGVQADLYPADQLDRVVNPYLFAGVGLTYLNSFARFQDKWVSLPRAQTENVDYNRYPFIFKLAIGHPILIRFRYRLTGEFGYTTVFSDYLDDVSSVYPDFTKLSPLGNALSDRRYALPVQIAPAQPGDQRGNSIKRDGYFSLSLRLTRTLATEADKRYKRVIGW